MPSPTPSPPPAFALFDRATLPAPLEMDTTIGMEQFQSAQEQQARSYAETVRLGDEAPAAPGAGSGGELLPDLVMPGAAPGSTPAPPATRARAADLSVAEAMVVCRRRNRVAPVPPAWDLLLAQLQSVAGTAPSLPDGDSLAARSMLAQRMVMRDLLVWAAARGLLAEAMAFLERLPESAWSHMES